MAQRDTGRERLAYEVRQTDLPSVSGPCRRILVFGSRQQCDVSLVQKLTNMQGQI